MMALIRGRRNASTEMVVVRLLRAAKIAGWRRHHGIIGKPDFVFKKEKVAVFVDGCFWHGCPKHFKAPKSRVDFWETKITGNIRRDRRVDAELRKLGWMVIRIWEHDLTRSLSPRAVIRIKKAVDSRRMGSRS
jgi:DNA mismatch endonuclease (patch repair protein)